MYYRHAQDQKRLKKLAQLKQWKICGVNYGKYAYYSEQKKRYVRFYGTTEARCIRLKKNRSTRHLLNTSLQDGITKGNYQHKLKDSFYYIR